MSNLTPQQDNFAQLVARGNTYADAYRGAYKVGENTKLETIWCESSKLMSNPNVSQRVIELRDAAIKSNEATLIEVLEELANWVRLDPIDFVDENGCVKNMRDMPKNVRKCLASPIEVMELFSGRGEEREKIGELKTIRFVDRTKAIDMMMKKLGQYITKLELKTDDLTHIKELLEGISE